MDTQLLPGMENIVSRVPATPEDDTKRLLHKEIAAMAGVHISYVSAMCRAGLPWRPTRSQVVAWMLQHPDFRRAAARKLPRKKQIQEQFSWARPHTATNGHKRPN